MFESTRTQVEKRTKVEKKILSRKDFSPSIFNHPEEEGKVFLPYFLPYLQDHGTPSISDEKPRQASKLLFSGSGHETASTMHQGRPTSIERMSVKYEDAWRGWVFAFLRDFHPQNEHFQMVNFWKPRSGWPKCSIIRYTPYEKRTKLYRNGFQHFF